MNAPRSASRSALNATGAAIAAEQAEDDLYGVSNLLFLVSEAIDITPPKDRGSSAGVWSSAIGFLARALSDRAEFVGEYRRLGDIAPAAGSVRPEALE